MTVVSVGMVVSLVAYESYGQYFSLLPAIPTLATVFDLCHGGTGEKTTRTLCLNNVIDVACLPVTWARHSYRESDAAIALPRSYMAWGYYVPSRLCGSPCQRCPSAQGRNYT